MSPSSTWRSTALAPFGGSVADLQGIVNAYTITFAAFILTAGALGDRLGARRVFIAGFAIFLLASLACALAPALPVSDRCALRVRVSARRFWCQIRWRCSIMPIRRAGDRHWRSRHLGRAARALSLTAGTIDRRRVDRAPRAGAAIFFDQSANRPCRHLADLALRERDSALGRRQLDIPRADHGGAGAGSLAGGDDRGRRTRLGDSLVLTGFAASRCWRRSFSRSNSNRKHRCCRWACSVSRAFGAMSLTGLLINIGCLRLDLRVQLSIFSGSISFRRCGPGLPSRR